MLVYSTATSRIYARQHHHHTNQAPESTTQVMSSGMKKAPSPKLSKKEPEAR
ncbi:hypothetical protein FHX51_000410 [Aeriscardovia aeriphila]|uniref:hypothetical protein n=1 Tax=Aeriscardovia aeriphila TaxID=218139 RepID=UPI0015CAC312|nr:hypothetical protein [Aeriscardovia aeriphila]NYI25462.1 hypothetical protein [Aeriscardovia aeriphila]